MPHLMVENVNSNVLQRLGICAGGACEAIISVINFNLVETLLKDKHFAPLVLNTVL
jgi:hypothetical protein